MTMMIMIYTDIYPSNPEILKSLLDTFSLSASRLPFCSLFTDHSLVTFSSPIPA